MSKERLLDSEYDVLHQIENKSDFLHSAVDQYIRDAAKDDKPNLVQMWDAIKQDEQEHLKMLKEQLKQQLV